MQFCPRCRSANIRVSTLLPLGNPFDAQGYLGWECLDCGYAGKDFFLLDRKGYELLLKETVKKEKKEKGKMNEKMNEKMKEKKNENG